MNPGRPSYHNEQYLSWLCDMEPFLKSGISLYGAIEKAGLQTHKDSIYRKYRLKDWFCEKIIIFQRYPGELVNAIFARRIEALHEQVLLGKPLNKCDVRLLCFAANKLRSCQPFFVSRSKIPETRRTKLEKFTKSLE